MFERCATVPHSVVEFCPEDVLTAPSYQFVSKLLQRLVFSGLPIRWRHKLDVGSKMRVAAVCHTIRKP